MSLKDEIEYVKAELSGDEKVLESAFKLENFYKKHKKKLWTVAAVAVLALIGKTGADMWKETRLEAANAALLTLQQNPKESKALKTLRESNPKLYTLYVLSEAARTKDAGKLQALTSEKDDILSDMARYTLSGLQKKPEDSVLYKELVYLQQAYLLLQDGKRKEAANKLELIPERSALGPVARLLAHYTIKAK